MVISTVPPHTAKVVGLILRNSSTTFFCLSNQLSIYMPGAREKAPLFGLKRIRKNLAAQQPRTSLHFAASELNLISPYHHVRPGASVRVTCYDVILSFPVGLHWGLDIEFYHRICCK